MVCIPDDACPSTAPTTHAPPPHTRTPSPPHGPAALRAAPSRLHRHRPHLPSTSPPRPWWSRHGPAGPRRWGGSPAPAAWPPPGSTPLLHPPGRAAAAPRRRRPHRCCCCCCPILGSAAACRWRRPGSAAWGGGSRLGCLQPWQRVGGEPLGREKDSVLEQARSNAGRQTGRQAGRQGQTHGILTCPLHLLRHQLGQEGLRYCHAGQHGGGQLPRSLLHRIATLGQRRQAQQLLERLRLWVARSTRLDGRSRAWFGRCKTRTAQAPWPAAALPCPPVRGGAPYPSDQHVPYASLRDEEQHGRLAGGKGQHKHTPLARPVKAWRQYHGSCRAHRQHVVLPAVAR